MKTPLSFVLSVYTNSETAMGGRIKMGLQWCANSFNPASRRLTRQQYFAHETPETMGTIEGTGMPRIVLDC
jgi:hypothetical protein